MWTLFVTSALPGLVILPVCHTVVPIMWNRSMQCQRIYKASNQWLWPWVSSMYFYWSVHPGCDACLYSNFWLNQWCFRIHISHISWYSNDLYWIWMTWSWPLVSFCNITDKHIACPPNKSSASQTISTRFALNMYQSQSAKETHSIWMTLTVTLKVVYTFTDKHTPHPLCDTWMNQ